MRVAGPGIASAGAGSGNEGNKAMKDGAGFSVSRTRLHWITHQALVEHACQPPDELAS